MKLIEIQGDVFAALHIAAITRDGTELTVTLNVPETSFCYDYESEELAAKAVSTMVDELLTA